MAITYLRSTDKAAQIARTIESKGRRCLAIQADSGDPAAVRRSVVQTVEALGGLDILVNNVGIASSAPLADMSFDDIDTLLNVNARAAVLASQAAIPLLKQGGRIITIGSCLAERVPYPNLTVYSMSKSALLAFTRGLARELGPRDITVNLVQPGPIDTDQNPANGARAKANIRLTSLGRYGKPADIAAVVTFLASPAAHFMTGSAVTADAGSTPERPRGRRDRTGLRPVLLQRHIRARRMRPEAPAAGWRRPGLEGGHRACGSRG